MTPEKVREFRAPKVDVGLASLQRQIWILTRSDLKTDQSHWVTEFIISEPLRSCRKVDICRRVVVNILMQKRSL